MDILPPGKETADSYYSCFICSTFADFFLSNAIFSYKTDYLDCDSCCRLPSSLQISGQPVMIFRARQVETSVYRRIHEHAGEHYHVL